MFFAINGFLVWLLAIVIGTVVGAVAVILLKSIGRKKADEIPEDAIDLEHSHVPTHATQPTTA